jgi:hypothetical protein
MAPAEKNLFSPEFFILNNFLSLSLSASWRIER